jgi:hypothetical protein
MRHRRPSGMGTAIFVFTLFVIIAFIVSILGVAIGLRLL